MQFSKNNSERGQIIVILAIALVVLLAFASLAIDVGTVYADRQYDQASADSAALSAGQKAADIIKDPEMAGEKFKCSAITSEEMSSIYTAAINSAAANDFTLSLQNLDNSDHGVQIRCNDTGGDNYVDIRVKITTVSKTSFMHLFYGGELKNTVESVVRVKPRSPLAFGNAIVAVGGTCDKKNSNKGGIWFDGTNKVKVQDGGIFSNTCIDKNGSSGFISICESGTDMGAVGVDCKDYEDDINIGFVTTFSGSTKPFNPIPEKSVKAIEKPEVPDLEAECAALNNDMRGKTVDKLNMTPGQYSGMVGNINLVEDGLYCFYGTIDLSGNKKGDFTSSGDAATKGVTIYFASGGIDMTGNSKLILKGATLEENGAIPGLLITLKKGNTSQIDIGGNAESNISGTVLAPESLIRLHGNPSQSFHSQIIGSTVLLDGGAELNVVYSDDMVYTSPAYLSLQK